VLYDEIASYILFEKYIYILPLEMASPRNHCANCIGSLLFPVPPPTPMFRKFHVKDEK